MESMQGAVNLFPGKMSAAFKRPRPDNSSDSDSDCAPLRPDLMHEMGANDGGLFTDGPKPGKKTKGRVKIKMEFIENKLRRYTTFSKRKTGIMKKAYELSTLTGTQVMLLVASETGHVYTFATRKLQPMITSESGKALIQTCLNSPDNTFDQVSADQRMNPTGYEETELSYVVSDDEQPSSSSSPPKIGSDKHVMMTTSNNKSNNNNNDNNNSSRSNHSSTNPAPTTSSSSTSSSSSSTSSSSTSSAQHRLLYQLTQESPSSLRLQNPPMELRPKEESGSSMPSISRSENHGNQSRTKEKPAVNGTFPAAASTPEPTGTISGSVGHSGIQTHTSSSSNARSRSRPQDDRYMHGLAPLTSLGTQNNTQQTFITIPIPISLSNVASQMVARQLLGPIKSELLPTDLG